MKGNIEKIELKTSSRVKTSSGVGFLDLSGYPFGIHKCNMEG